MLRDGEEERFQMPCPQDYRLATPLQFFQRIRHTSFRYFSANRQPVGKVKLNFNVTRLLLKSLEALLWKVSANWSAVNVSICLHLSTSEWQKADVTESRNGKPEIGIWERIYSGNPHEKSKWLTKPSKDRSFVLATVCTSSFDVSSFSLAEISIFW